MATCRPNDVRCNPDKIFPLTLYWHHLQVFYASVVVDRRRENIQKECPDLPSVSPQSSHPGTATGRKRGLTSWEFVGVLLQMHEGVFTALQLCSRGIPMSICPSVRLSVCPPVCQTRELWQNERNICPNLTPYERSMHLVFWHEEWLMGDVPFYLKFWTKVTRPPLQKRRFSIRSLSVSRNT